MTVDGRYGHSDYCEPLPKRVSNGGRTGSVGGRLPKLDFNFLGMVTNPASHRSGLVGLT